MLVDISNTWIPTSYGLIMNNVNHNTFRYTYHLVEYDEVVYN